MIEGKVKISFVILVVSKWRAGRSTEEGVWMRFH